MDKKYVSNKSKIRPLQKADIIKTHGSNIKIKNQLQKFYEYNLGFRRTLNGISFIKFLNIKI